VIALYEAIYAEKHSVSVNDVPSGNDEGYLK
jgi:hypothetical protein